MSWKMTGRRWSQYAVLKHLHWHCYYHNDSRLEAHSCCHSLGRVLFKSVTIVNLSLSGSEIQYEEREIHASCQTARRIIIHLGLFEPTHMHIMHEESISCDILTFWCSLQLCSFFSFSCTIFLVARLKLKQTILWSTNHSISPLWLCIVKSREI